MSDTEIEMVEKILKELQPKHCLEWGAGGSSTYFPKPYMKSWTSVEHNGNWVKKIAEDIPSNVNLVWAPEDVFYEDCVKHSRTYDFILIDGLHRERCVEIARQIISDNGVILLHDSGREEYQKFISENDGEKLIDGEEPFRGFYKHRGLTMFRRANVETT